MEFNLKKILIFGNSGSGKSTLAKQLVEKDNLAHLDLVVLAWLPITPPERAPLEESKQKIEEFISTNKSWVIEGCYTDLMEMVSHVSSEIIFLNLSIEQCVENAKARPWEPDKYESKEAQDANLDMLIKWIKDYKERDDVFSFNSHMQFYEEFNDKKTIYNSNERNT